MEETESRAVHHLSPWNGWDMQKCWFDPKGINSTRGGGWAGLAGCCVAGTIWRRQSKMMITWKKDNLSWLPLSPSSLERRACTHWNLCVSLEKNANWHCSKENISFDLFSFLGWHFGCVVVASDSKGSAEKMWRVDYVLLRFETF